MERITKDDLPALVKRVLEKLEKRAEKNRAALVTLQGDLGAGKTTFTQALAAALGVDEAVVSPTYVIMKTYPLHNQSPLQPWEWLVHIDAYRLSDADEFAALKPASFLLDPAALVVIEWPERIEGALPKPDAVLSLSSEAAESEERYIEIA